MLFRSCSRPSISASACCHWSSLSPGTPRMSRLSFYSSPASRMGTAFSFVHANPPDCNFYISGALLHKQFLTSCPAVCISNISTSLDKIMILKFIISYFHLASLTNCIYNSCTYQKVVTPSMSVHLLSIITAYKYTSVRQFKG